jgi:peroxisomal enoyl-CoA hydratase 2
VFANLISGRGQAVPGLPKFNPDRVIHGSQSIEILKPLPKEGGAGWNLKSRIVGVHENSQYTGLWSFLDLPFDSRERYYC